MTDSTDNARGPERICDWCDETSLQRKSRCPVKGCDIRADLSPDPLRAMKVKPLEWAQIESVLPRIVYETETPFGRYQAWPNGCWRLVGSGAGFHMIDETLEAAKAAAQADYEQRIRSALEPDPQDARVAALVEALIAMLDHSGVADAGPDMKDPEDHAAERQARAAFGKGCKDES